MKDTKNIVIAVLAVLLVGGGGWVLMPDDTPIEPVVPVDGIDGKDGNRGNRGPAGIAGPMGPQGPQGMSIAGADGADAVIDLTSLVDTVINEIEDREDRVTFGFVGEHGDYSYSFVVEDDDMYEFTIRHFGSGDFDVSIEDENGNVSTLVDSNGHLSYNDSRVLSEGDYIVKVSADGSWEVEIEEK